MSEQKRNLLSLVVFVNSEEVEHINEFYQTTVEGGCELDKFREFRELWEK